MSGLRGIPFNPQTLKAETNNVVLRKAASDNANGSHFPFGVGRLAMPKHFIPCAGPAFSICHYWSGITGKAERRGMITSLAVATGRHAGTTCAGFLTKKTHSDSTVPEYGRSRRWGKASKGSRNPAPGPRMEYTLDSCRFVF